MLLNLKIIYYIYVFLVSKQELYDKYILNTSKCGASELCLNKLKICGYKKKDNDYRRCISLNLFGKSVLVSELPDEIKNPYLNKFYSAGESWEPHEKLKNVYFEFILDILELAFTNESYNYLYGHAVNSLLLDIGEVKSDIENGKIDISVLRNVKFSNLQEIIFYNYIAYKRDKEVGNGIVLYNSIVKFNGNYNEKMFYSIINEKFFQNKLTNDQIHHIIEYHDDKNLKGLLLSEQENGNFEKRDEFLDIIISGISELNEFLVGYDSTNYKDIIDNLYYDNKSNHNVFEMINNISNFLYNPINIKYNYTKDNNDFIHLTSKLDINSIYGNSTTVAESIYNWIYDYYDSIYTAFINDVDTTNTYDIYYYNNNTLLYNTEQEKESMYLLEKSDFYNSIYSTVISLGINNKNNSYIEESVKLVNELYIYYSLGNYKLKNFDKKNLNDTQEINYEEYINDTFDAVFKENTFKYLIDSDEININYLDDLKNHISQSCELYNNEQVHPMVALSVIELENYYNVVYGKDDDSLNESQYCDGDYEGVIYKLRKFQNNDKDDYNDYDVKNKIIDRNMSELVSNIILNEIIRLNKLDRNENSSNDLRKKGFYQVKFDYKTLSKKISVNDLYETLHRNEDIYGILNIYEEIRNKVNYVIDKINITAEKEADITLYGGIYEKIYKILEKINDQNKKITIANGMKRNKEPEVRLVDALNSMNELYGSYKISRNNLDAFHEINLSSKSKQNIGSYESIFKFDVKFNAPEKIISTDDFKNGFYADKEKDNLNNINQINNYSETLLKLKKIKLNKKYEKNGQFDIYKKDEAINEIIKFINSYYVAIRNPMIYGKCIHQFFDNEQLDKFSKFDEEDQDKIIEQLMNPVDSKLLFKQAINKIIEDLHVEYSNDNKIENIKIQGKIKTESNIEVTVNKSITNDTIQKIINEINKDKEYIMNTSNDYASDLYNEHLNENDFEDINKNKNIIKINDDYKNSLEIINTKFENSFKNEKNSPLNCRVIGKYNTYGEKMTSTCKNNKKEQEQKLEEINLKNKEIIVSFVENPNKRVTTKTRTKTLTKTRTTRRNNTIPTHHK